MVQTYITGDQIQYTAQIHGLKEIRLQTCELGYGVINSWEFQTSRTF